MSEARELTPTAVNIPATYADPDTSLAQSRSGAVHALPKPHPLEASIVIARSKVGAFTPHGRRLSMLVEQLNNGISPVQTIREIEQIQRDGGRYVHGNHGAVR